MKRRMVMLLVVMSILSSCVVLFASCSHVHTLAEGWESDATYHWKKCDKCDEQVDKAEHDFTNGDCVCGKEHTHVLDDDYHCTKCRYVDYESRYDKLIELGYEPADSIDKVMSLLSENKNVVLTADIEFLYTNKGNITNKNTSGVLDANGHTIFLEKETEKAGYVYFYGDNEIRDAVFTAVNTNGIATNTTSFYNCTFDCIVWVTVTDDVNIDRCIFNNKYLAFSYSEVENINPKDYKVTVVNNVFNVNKEKVGIELVMYGEDGNIFADGDCSQYISITNNEFAPMEAVDKYDAIRVSGNDVKKKVSGVWQVVEERIVYDATFNADIFAENKFSGKANLLLNNIKNEDEEIRVELS